MSEEGEVLEEEDGTATDGGSFSMSDEEFSNMDLDTLIAAEPQEQDPDDSGEDDAEDAVEDDPAGSADTGDDAEDDEEADDVEDQEDEDLADGKDADEEDGDDTSADDDDGEETDKDSTDDNEPVDFEAFNKRITAPFRANGKDLQFDSPDDIVRLMQMGANYNRKMAQLKPNLQILKTLEKGGLLDANKVNFLIDLEQGKPEAIAQLLRDKGVDPMDLNLGDQTDYTAADHSVDEREVALDEAIDSISDSPTFNQTLDVVSKQWDAASKQEVVNSPELLGVIDGHMQSGIYEVISTEMERQRTLGQLSGMSDFAAYKKIGDEIDARKGFDHLFQPEQGQQSQQQEEITTPAPKKADKQRRDKRRAAGSPKAAVESSSPVVNPLALSDEDFDKQYDARLM